MGTDNLFHKRKALRLGRSEPKRAPYDKVLIVCEGSKTEPNYFRELIDHYEINTANVQVDGSCGSDPMSVANHAIQLYREERDKGDPYDRVYCVIDRDAHPGFGEALKKLEAQKPPKVFYATVSIPCFEYWLLLHFDYTRAAFTSTGRVSMGDAALVALKTCLPKYEKGLVGTFSSLIGQLAFAKANAKRGLEDARKTAADNPSTNVHELVEYLQNIKGKKPE
ncbi:MAG: RloB family protein [Moraxellaceae bacterium]|nr:RloB family protein [Moraxellaceae bacterium]